ncbi:6-phosphofructokinase [bacterium (Candidatus Blackallbacteria) CG17_big_fil_post_rev_8_21_14_2_50_48_46]|uniref:ATP-dependent 6-phosphofructokinase n=1 Tax=bacterium (Candidatus Blackallbacteria) CG17_big_fil_post_rev_8_21_14_2_50_48_46 TaxID=2014261 RepID=A0A2M7G4X1_9BACT|nr:MAG: 6-phosphofructokinase [bacterium (Candidatus Blackallbacteria) CG18_big_fil_WC_8_21_14_2_50_49_26]PIW16999.1 MAG: 6-phosphofructokinase [bacterium (Candidatus Blackallbacteria) CG17_big_fil_post_rev_8_21_14_2_50_48_46]PIW48193.1 MAG: 6-phosphofructokinase [bacterium (Candidatus Blackallbacteria) CG13_big_fil_rev_8_21_14_2_50_49_14]
MAYRQTKRLAINTGGGDAPGLNGVIRAVVLSAYNRGWEVYGIHDGYRGLIDTEEITHLTPALVRDILPLGGTIIGTTNKGNPFEMPVTNAAGETEMRDISDRIVDNFKRLNFNALITVGGDGSLAIAYKLFQKGLPVIGVPKTIDNDLSSTVVTFGFDTAVTTATEAIDKLHTTAKAHDRVMVVELMGRYAGWIALNAGISGAADAILIPEIPYDMEIVCRHLMEGRLQKKDYGIVVVAEGAAPKGGGLSVKGAAIEGRQEVLLGGLGEQVARQIKERTGVDTRYVVLGHLQRGGSPTTFDRLVATRFGAAAVRAVEEEKFGHMIALDPPTVKYVHLEDALSRMKQVPLDCDSIISARDIGICLGDE